MRYAKHILTMAGTCLLLATSLEAVKKTKAYEHQQLTDAEVAEQESKLIAMVNQERQKNGLKPLSTWNVLTIHARQHSQAMADGKVDFGHAGFQNRANAVQKAAKCYSVGENVAYCYLIADPLQTSVEMWMESLHHKENIVGDYMETGIGICYNRDGHCYITQLFAKRR